ncbi:MAG: hypothetical protein E6Q83_17435 [Thiothrix sp.]|nr:MAG: hypothetical protein E6Q83_17435 [Thiothrix sp.]
MKLRSMHKLSLAVSVFSLATPLMAAPVNTLSPWSSGFSPWSMGSSPWSSGFSPWGMGSSPWSSGFSPWSMGGSPWSTSFTPWNGNNGSASMLPWSSGFSPWGGNNWGNAWGNNAWLPWSNGSNFFGRRNNNDWVTSMFLMNSIDQQQPWNAGMLPNYPYQAPSWQQVPMQQVAPNGFYQAAPVMTYPHQSQTVQTPPPSNFPETSSKFSPFLQANPPSSSGASIPSQSSVSTEQPAPITSKTLVFPDGSRF